MDVGSTELKILQSLNCTSIKVIRNYIY